VCLCASCWLVSIRCDGQAHTDVDETLAAEQEIFRTPRHAHVLYLQVGSKVQGPTCVFDVTNGDELRRGATLTVVPAVAGRLLRFDGSLLHAVPRPHDLWTLPFVSRQRREPAHEWGRAVVLFNTWPDASRPPLGVSWEPPALTDTPTAELSDAPAAACAPAATWSEQVIGDKRRRSSAVTAKVTAKVWLLGERQRRAVPERTVSLSAPDTLSQTLGHSSRVTRVPMDALPA